MIKILSHEIENKTEEIDYDGKVLGSWTKNICHRIVFSTDEDIQIGQTLVIDDTPVTVISFDGFYYTAEAQI